MYLIDQKVSTGWLIMTKLIIVLLVFTSSFQIYLADTPNYEEATEDETQPQDEASDQWSSSSLSTSSSSSSSSSFSSSSSSSSFSQSQTEDCGPPVIPRCKNPNEVYDPCDAPCPARRCDFDLTVTLCKVAPKVGDEDCLIGCRCIDGYVRNDTGVCIPRDKCPPKQPICGTNEVYDPCDAPCPARRCDFDATVVRCKAPPKVGDEDCLVGCRCIDGYARNDAGVCIPIEKCPPKRPICGTNEVYDPCPNCSPQTCETMNKTYSCPAIPASKTGPGCNPSCRCQKGYYRNKIGECIAASDCLKCTKSHEYFSCGSACDNVCESIKKQNQTNCPIINVKCNEMCYCEKDYARDYKNDCIPIKDCPSCPVNERYDPCPATLCIPQKCDEAGFPLNCTQREGGFPCPGKPGCVCKDGYLRNKKGICIPSYECPSCGGDKNATQGCGVNCNRRCSDLNKKPHGCILICYPNSCDCKTDKNGNKYYYDDNTKKCVLPQDCTPTCSSNEEYSDCINSGCTPQNCSQLGKPVPCVRLRPEACIKGCVCKQGYLRADNSTCIPEKQCPSCGDDPNAESGCGTFCETCANYKKGPVACPAICQINGCQCKKGYIYDQNIKKCVPPKQCTPTCKANEVYSDCVNGGCDARNCSQLGYPVPCVKLRPEDCIEGCICAPGYLRAKNGTCIPVKQCPCCAGDPNAESGCGVFCDRCSGPIPCPKICKVNACQCKKDYVYDDNTKRCVLPKDCTPKCGSNEVFDPCPDCSPQTCETMNKTYHCPLIPASKTGPGCKPSCRCKKGYFRNKIGQCIAASDCLKCPKPHEYFSCGGACDNVCDTLEEQNQTHCPIKNKKCNEMCYCEKGYARDYKNDCIPIKDCPTCPVNERYDPCPATLCTPQTCDQAGFPLNCTQGKDGCPCPGKPGCVCKNGYLRNKKGICVPSSECPSCGGDKNATHGCGVNCNRHCYNVNQKEPQMCILICYPNSCDCKTDKDGIKYYYDDNTKKCVLPQDCTPTCTENEVYSDCINGGCDPRNCSQLGKPVPCVNLVTGACIKGCICKPGYLRAENGTCIPEKQCPFCGDDPNAESGCGTFCETCANYKQGPVACPDICQINGCQCKKGYIYDQNTKKCVLPKQCTPTCKANEVYSDCVNGGCDARNCSQLGYPVPCVKKDPKDCIKGCVCAPGYLRAKNGTCIPVKQCPGCGGDPNAESGCGVFCDRCSGPIPCPRICKVNACQCKKGHVYDDNTKKCVLPKNCTPNCGYNEVFDPCPDCSPQTCETINIKYPCPLIPADKAGSGCRPSCRCKKGYYRNKIGECIAANDCLKCPKPHEYYSCGGACDNVCENIKKQNQTNCPIINIKCNEMCYCEKDYARDYKNDCIPIKDCPTCPVNERYDPCPATLCTPQKCDEAGFPLNCTQREEGCPCPGKPGCVCKDGYLRNKKGKCIPSNECPSCGDDKNATLGCGVNCNRHCSDLGLKEPRACIEVCYPNSCDCRTDKDGTMYYYDDKTKKCVLPQDCKAQVPTITSAPSCDYEEPFYDDEVPYCDV